MAEPLSTLSPEKFNSNPPIATDDDMENSWHDPPSSPFISHLDHDDQENIAPAHVFAPTPVKPLVDSEDNVPQSAFKISSPLKTSGLKERMSPVKTSPSKSALDDFEDAVLGSSIGSRGSPKKTSPVKRIPLERPESAMSSRSRKNGSPAKSSRNASVETTERLPEASCDIAVDIAPSTEKPLSSSYMESGLRDNEGLTVAMKVLEETHSESHEDSTSTTYHTETEALASDDVDMEDADFNPDGPDFTSLDMGMDDDTCFSTFSEMPGLDMTKFSALRNSPTRNELLDQETPRAARTQITPSTVRRTERTPSPTPGRIRKENDTTNLLLDFTAQIEAFGASRHGPPARGHASPNKSSTEPNLLSYIQSQRTPAKPSSLIPSTPSTNRQGLLNLLDFELPPPPTPRSVPTVTIRELESLKSSFQSQISSLSASLSGKEAQVGSLVKAIADAERRVGEAQESLRDERSARDYAEAQMVDWKKKGEEVQGLLQDVQSEMARNDSERENLLSRISEFEKRTEDAEARAAELETRAIEAESRNVDMTTFINPDESNEDRKIYSETDCQAAIAEKVNEVARDLHSAYKAKHEKKIKALKDNYQKKADERCKELRVQIIRLERQVEELEKKRDDTFSKVLPTTASSKDLGQQSAPTLASNPGDLKRLEALKFELENTKAQLAGLESEISSLRKSNDVLLQDLELERVEKADLVHAAEEMLTMCAAQMEEKAQEDLRKSTLGGALPTAPPSASESSTPRPAKKRPGSALSGGGRPGSAIGDRLGAMSEKSGIAKPSGLRAPGGFGFGQRAELTRSTSGNKSRIMNNIERMGSGRTQSHE